MRKSILVGFFILFSTYSYAESSGTINSIVDKLHTQAYSTSNLDSIYILADSALSISKKDNYPLGTARSYHLIGYVHEQNKELSKALISYYEALESFDLSNVPQKDKGRIFLNMGRIYRVYSNIESAISIYNEGIKYCTDNGFEDLIIKFQYNKGVAYRANEQNSQALLQFFKSLEISEANKDYKRLFNSYNQIGLVHYGIENYDSAIAYFNKALYFVDELSKPGRYKAQALHNIGLTYFRSNDYPRAHQYFIDALSLQKESGNAQDIFIIYKDLAQLRYSTGNYAEAISIGSNAVTYHQQGTDPEIEHLEIYRILSNSNLKQGKNSEGIAYANLYDTHLQRYLSNRENNRILQDKYQIDLITKQYFLNKEKLRKERQINNLVVTIISIVGFVILSITILRILFFTRKRSVEQELLKEIEAQQLIFNNNG